MSQLFGASFQGVKFHKDSKRASDMGALAFTQGKDVHFAPGQYNPGTSEGKDTIAHELRHVQHQEGGNVKPTKEVNGEPVNDDGGMERDADSWGRKARSFDLASKALGNHKPFVGVPGKGLQHTARGGSIQRKVIQMKEDPAKAPPAGGGGGAAPVPVAGGGGNAPAGGPVASGGGGLAAPGGGGPVAGGGSGAGGGSKGGGSPVAKSGGGKGVVGKYLNDQVASKIKEKLAKITELAKNEKEKTKADKKREESEKAAVAPTKEGESKSNAEQATSLDGTTAPQVDEQSAKQEFDTKLTAALPTSVDDVDSFKSKGKAKDVGNAVKSIVAVDTSAVLDTYGDIKTPPAPKQVPDAVAMPDIEKAVETANMQLSQDLVAPLLPEHTDFSQYEQDSDKLVTDGGITDEHMELVDSGDLFEAQNERKGLKEKVATASTDIDKVRTDEVNTLNEDLGKEEEEGKKQMRTDRDKELKAARDKQTKAKGDFELKRQKVTEHINGIYENAKTQVETKLKNLEESSLKRFEDGQAAASKTFEDNVNRRMEDFKKDRYGDGLLDGAAKTASGVANTLSFGLVGEKGGATAWVEDKLLGMDRLPEVNTIFTEEKAAFVTAIDQLITTITADNQAVITECQDIIAGARKEIDVYVEGLPGELQSVGETAQGEIETKLDELDQQVEDKEAELQETLEAKKEEAIAAIDKKIEEMKEDMGGILSKLGNLLLDAAIKFFKWALEKAGADAESFMATLKAGKDAIIKIVKKPIDFLNNLISAVKDGFNNFKAELPKNLMSGMVNWLTGQMSGVGIEIPEKFDLKGILGMGMQVMGLTWPFIREKLAKNIGEEKVAAAEQAFDVVKTVVTEGPMALWDQLKEKVGEIKDTVISGIKEWAMTQIIQQGILFVLSMLNPAGAIVRAIMSIYKGIMFFVDNKDRITQLITTIIGTISQIANGQLGGAMTAIASTLMQMIPLVIDFLAKILNLSGITKAIKKVIDKITEPIHKAIDKAVAWLVKKIKAWLKKVGKKLGLVKDDKKPEGEDDRDQAEKQEDLQDAIKEIKEIASHTSDEKEIEKEFPRLKQKHDLTDLKVVKAKNEKIEIFVKVNPEETVVIDVDDATIRKLFFVKASELLANQDGRVNIHESIIKILEKHETRLSSSNPKERENAQMDLRKKNKRFSILEGAIYVPYLTAHQQGREQLNEELQKEEGDEANLKFMVSLERGGTFLTDQLDAKDKLKAKNKLSLQNIPKPPSEGRDAHFDKVGEYIEEIMSNNPNQNVKVVIAEPYISGSAVRHLVKKQLIKLLEEEKSDGSLKYPNLSFKLLLLRETSRYNDEELSENKPEEAINDLIDKKSKLKEVTAAKIQVFSADARYILGEDIDYQVAKNSSASKQPIMVFNGGEEGLRACQLCPKENYTSRDVLISLVKGNYTQELKTMGIL